MHNNEERFRVAASFQFRSSRGAETNESERRGGKRRKSRQRGKSEGRQVFRLPELTKSLWREWKNYCMSSPLPPTYAQEPLWESARKLKYKSKNLWISYTKWRAESELSWVWVWAWAGELWVSAWATLLLDPAPAKPTLGRGLDAFKLKQTI